jgi:galactokinase
VIDITAYIKMFEALFGTGKAPELFFAPGRVNLIGEHIDYNGGYVFPAALELGNYVLARLNGTSAVRLAASDLSGLVVSCELSRLDEKKGKSWGSYQLGVIDEILKLGIQVPGCDMLYIPTLPHGAGLSSSASIEVATAAAVLGLCGAELGLTEIALLCQRAENNFVGVNCGIMDQFASANGKSGCGMLLDCASLYCEHVPLNMDGYSIVIGNTNKKRSLAESKYNERRAECELALSAFHEKMPHLENLCALKLPELQTLLPLLSDENAKKRAIHAVTENERVLESVSMLKKGDIEGFGRLLNESHFSLRDLYEVTGFELDMMTELARNHKGCVGSRMTGAGFGGCTVSIVENGAVSDFISAVGEGYKEKTRLTPEFYVSNAGQGVSKIKY